MFTEPLTVHQTLEFVLRHLAFHSVTGLAQIVGVEGSGVRAGLTGKRPIPLVQVGKLAAAAGLKLQIDDAGGQQLRLAPDVAVHLEVNMNELMSLQAVVHALGPKPPVWKFVQAVVPGKGTLMTILARLELNRHGNQERGYIAAHISDLLLEPGLACVQEQLAGRQEIPEPALEVDDVEWIRLRAGLYGSTELDQLYRLGVEPQPTAYDWADLLREAGRLGMAPRDIILMMRDMDSAMKADLS